MMTVQYLGRGFHGSIRWGGDYTDDWHHGGQWLRHRCGHTRRRRRRRGNNSRYHPNREWQRRGRGCHDHCGCGQGHQGNGRCGYTGLRIGGRARKGKRRKQTEKDETKNKVYKAGGKSEKREAATSQGGRGTG